MFTEHNDLDVVLLCPDQFLPEPFMLRGDVPVDLLQVLLSVDHEPGVIQAHIIADIKFADIIIDVETVKLFGDPVQFFLVLSRIDLYLHLFPL